MVSDSLPTMVTAFLLAAVIGGGSANAQGLIFHLPEDGMAVEYEGTLTQGTGPDDQKPLSWTSELSIKSVGREEAEFEGQVQPCRWLEIKTLTGKAGAAGIDPGPVGARIYKVLVPESKVLHDWKDASGIPNEMLPIVKGFRRLGEEAVNRSRHRRFDFIQRFLCSPAIQILKPLPHPTLPKRCCRVSKLPLAA